MTLTAEQADAVLDGVVFVDPEAVESLKVVSGFVPAQLYSFFDGVPKTRLVDGEIGMINGIRYAVER